MKDCDILQACYLVYLGSGDEVELDGNDLYELDSRNPIGYTIRCELVDAPSTSSNFIRFTYDNEVHDDFNVPRYMKGKSDDVINPVSYLNTCGRKKIKVEIHALSQACFTKEFLLDLVYIDGSCPTLIEQPTVAPVTMTPVNQPTMAPANSETATPVAPPTSVSSTSPTTGSAPFRSRTNQPTLKLTTPVPVVSVTNSSPIAASTVAPTTKKYVCTNTYVCPANSYRIRRRYCYDTFDDCECIIGYLRNNATKQCILEPTNVPTNLPTKVPTRSPTKGPSLRPSLAPTAKKYVCTNSYICPSNSDRIPGRYCYDTFDDCQCTTGYMKDMTKKQCQPIPTKVPTTVPKRPPTRVPSLKPSNSPTERPINEPTEAPIIDGTTLTPTELRTNLPTEAPIMDVIVAPPPPTPTSSSCTTTTNFVCPVNSYRIHGRPCYDSFDDCACIIGWVKDHDQCVPVKFDCHDDDDDDDDDDDAVQHFLSYMYSFFGYHRSSNCDDEDD